MKTIDQKLSDYIDEHDYEIVTSNGITISAWNEWILRAHFILAESEEAELHVDLCCDKKGFVRALGVRKIKDIYELTHERLTELFYEGLAELICDVHLDGLYVMAFQKQGNRILALNDWGAIHYIPVNENLETYDQFIAYACQYYKLLQCSEN